MVCGWVQTLRRMGGVTFLVLRDGWGTVQIVGEDAAAFAPLTEAGLGGESVIEAVGQSVAMPQAPGGVEIHAPQIRVITPVSEAPPVIISKREVQAGLAAQLDHAVIVNRHPLRRAIFRLAAGAMRGFRATLNERGLYRNSNAQNCGVGHGKRGECLSDRLLWRTCLFGAKSAIL